MGRWECADEIAKSVKMSRPVMGRCDVERKRGGTGGQSGGTSPLRALENPIV